MTLFRVVLLINIEETVLWYLTHFLSTDDDADVNGLTLVLGNYQPSYGQKEAQITQPT